MGLFATAIVRCPGKLAGDEFDNFRNRYFDSVDRVNNDADENRRRIFVDGEVVPCNKMQAVQWQDSMGKSATPAGAILRVRYFQRNLGFVGLHFNVCKWSHPFDIIAVSYELMKCKRVAGMRNYADACNVFDETVTFFCRNSFDNAFAKLGPCFEDVFTGREFWNV